MKTSAEKKMVWILCLLAAAHVFVFSAAFPFDNNMDEGQHFDLVIRYSQLNLPSGLEPMCEESSIYLLTFGSPEYIRLEREIHSTPFWLLNLDPVAKDKVRAAEIERSMTNWQMIKNQEKWKNYEASQQPLYYAIGGLWWRVGQIIGFEDLQLTYWLRFLNIFFVAVLVWLAFVIAKLVFPQNIFIRFSVPALIAFFPQQAFYSIQNDVLSPVCFALVFLGAIKLWRAETLDWKIGLFIGFSMAATFLTKLTNVPLLAVAGIVVICKIIYLKRSGRFAASILPFFLMLLSAAIPIASWLLWTKHAFGDFTGTNSKLEFITWTRKPFSEWFHHPIFSPGGFWTFISELIVNFWQGEFRWHNLPLDLLVPDTVYVVLTITFVALALAKTHLANSDQRRVLWFSFMLCAAGILFLACISINYNFGLCRNPSQEHPFLVAGRLILGALIPFLVVFSFGIYSLLREAKRWVQFATLITIIAFMLISEIVTDWPVFHSQYNWYHL